MRHEVVELPKLVEKRFKIQTYDIDLTGIVNNIVYVRWMEDLRRLMLDEYYPLEKFLEQNYIPIISSTAIEYKRPLRLSNIVYGRMWMEEAKKARWQVRAEFVMEEEKVAAIARQAGYFFDIKGNKPVELPDELRP